MIEVLKVNTTAEVVLRASSRLEKATKTTKSNCQPPHHAHSVPHCHISVVLEHPGRVTPPLPVPNSSLEKKLFPISNLTLLQLKLRPAPLILPTGTQKRGTKSRWTVSSSASSVVWTGAQCLTTPSHSVHCAHVSGQADSSSRMRCTKPSPTNPRSAQSTPCTALTKAAL